MRGGERTTVQVGAGLNLAVQRVARKVYTYSEVQKFRARRDYIKAKVCVHKFHVPHLKDPF